MNVCRFLKYGKIKFTLKKRSFSRVATYLKGKFILNGFAYVGSTVLFVSVNLAVSRFLVERFVIPWDSLLSRFKVFGVLCHRKRNGTLTRLL